MLRMARSDVKLRVTPRLSRRRVTMVNPISYEFILVEEARPSPAAVGAGTTGIQP